ncbi:MAG: hypothetical protein AAF608_15250, partial [Pseudomonadota bacterium]
SVLRTAQDVPRVAGEVYRHIREGRKVIAVVSAYEGVTDQYIAMAKQDGLAPDSPAYADLVAQGEFISAEALTNRLNAIGIHAALVSPKAIELGAYGPRDDAVPTSLDQTALSAALKGSKVICVPGFSAIGAHGGTRLLGRGGSDLTAIFLASETGAKAARLIKDVDGVYTSDPNRFENAGRYSRISWTEAGRDLSPVWSLI